MLPGHQPVEKSPKKPNVVRKDADERFLSCAAERAALQNCNNWIDMEIMSLHQSFLTISDQQTS